MRTTQNRNLTRGQEQVEDNTEEDNLNNDEMEDITDPTRTPSIQNILNNLPGGISLKNKQGQTTEHHG